MDPQPGAPGGLPRIMTVQQSWSGDDDTDRTSTWVWKHDDEVGVWPLLCMGAQFELRLGP